MGEEILMFGDIETEKNKFDHYKTPILKKCRYRESISI